MDAAALLSRALEKANTDGRNNAGLWLACQLRDARLDRAEAEAIMRDYAAAVPQHGRDPYTAGEALSTLAGVLKTAPRDPPPGSGPRRSRRQVQASALRRTFALTPEARPAVNNPPASDRTLREKLKGVQPLADSPGAAYLEGRGIPLDLALATNVRFHPAWPFTNKEGEWRNFPAVVYPMRDLAGELHAASGRRIANDAAAASFIKCTTLGGRRDSMLWTPGARESDPVLLVEGPMDALSLALCGYPAVARVATDFPPWLPRWAAFRDLYIAWDTDVTGEGKTQAVADACARTGAKCYRLRPPEGTGKDWNDALQAIGADALREYLENAIGAPQAGGLPKTAAQEARTAPAPPADVSEDPPDLLPGEAEILALLDAGLVTQDAAEAVLSDIFAGRPTPEPACPAPPASTQWESAFADRRPGPEPAAVDELRDRILAALEHTRALRPGESVSDPERYAAREAADALSPYPALAIGARTRLAHLGVSLPRAAV